MGRTDLPHHLAHRVAAAHPDRRFPIQSVDGDCTHRVRRERTPDRQAQRPTAAPLRRIPQRDVTRKRLPVGPIGRCRNDPSHTAGSSCSQDRAERRGTTSPYPSPSLGAPVGTRHRDRFNENLPVAGMPAEAGRRLGCPHPGSAADSQRRAFIVSGGGFRAARSTRRAVNHCVGPQHTTKEIGPGWTLGSST